MTYDDELTSIKGVGDAVAAKFAILGVKTVGDLVDYYPRKYDDFSVIDQIAKLRPGIVTIRVTIKQITGRYVRRGMHITEAVASDDTGSVRIIWFNQPYRQNSIETKAEYFVRGEFALRRQRLSIMNPSIELVSDFPIHTARIMPTYRTTKGLKSSQIRKTMANTLPYIKKLRETLPRWLLTSEQLIARSEALAKLHFPESLGDIVAAEHRIGFEEVFRLSLAALLNKQENASETSLAVPFKEDIAKQFVAGLPFTLTDAQRVVAWKIYTDLSKGEPMNRLIEGDVGSGKTVVACMAALMAMNAGYQVALMAPTEILARQHAETLNKLLSSTQLQDKVLLLVGSMSESQKRTARKHVASGEAGLIVGTNAIIQDKVTMKSLGLIIIDEQHRFGVEQRKKLQAKAGHMPHVLLMTATPIPRSLALTLYGELDVSILNEKPANRKSIITKLVSPNSRLSLYKKVDLELDAGRQIFVVCPLITESDDSSIQSAKTVYKQLRNGHFKHRKVGLLHGKMKTDEKDTIMKAFSSGDIDILVATTVVEVGVDIPNASVMIIENAERFGLAQIHQLRGRIGRNDYQGYCYLIPADSSAPTTRLRALETIQDGFRLAELDLELRGPGAIYGLQQHGALDLRVAKLSDLRLIAAARAAAQEFIDRGENLLKYKELQSHIQKLRAVTNLN